MQHAAPHQDDMSAGPGPRAGLGHAAQRLGDIARQLPRPSYAHLGWAFLLAWVFCTFYLHSVSLSLGDSAGIPATGTPTLASELVNAGAPLAISVLTLVFVVAFERRIGSLASRQALRIACPATTAVGTLLMYAPGADGIVGEALFLAGALLTGVGSAPLWVMWGELYAQLEQGVTEITSSISAVAAALLALLCASLAGWVALLVVALLPALSGIALSRAAHSRGAARTARTLADAAPSPVRTFVRSFGREGQGILVASAVVCYAGCFVPDMVPLGITQLALIGATALACVIAGVGILTPHHFNLQFLYRWMCPLVLASLASLVWFGPTLGASLAFGGSIGARLAFCLLTQVYFSRVAAEGHMTPTRIFGLGWICLHLGDLVGVALNVALASAAPQIATGAGCILALSLVMVASVMFTLNGRASFSQAGGTDPATAKAAPHPQADSEQRPDDTPATEPPRNAAAQQGSPAPGLRNACSPQQDARADDAPVATRCSELAEAHGLTAREREVLVLLAQGRSNPYIRDALTISLDTAGTHVKHVYAKLGVHSRQELIDLVQETPASL